MPATSSITGPGDSFIESASLRKMDQEAAPERAAATWSGASATTNVTA
ncbi:hypothetical protein BURPS1710b_2890 [Burkholderia pseudomallei 1710b]|uniref:Uncharacterized protein n=1 Tax=Burkholderia pseudomallei (strain 1710b) TaxID=320372 RepID=Q3JQ82_BURP1|nr:hypothetical protein BURPS1710b_2890 [Burkholderia pseudomallei 1710b]